MASTASGGDDGIPWVTELFACGCGIVQSTMTGKVLSVAQCDAHWTLRDEDKTLKAMATELRVHLKGAAA